MARTRTPQQEPGAAPQPLPDRSKFVTPGAYDPFEIVDLMTAFYELYVKMRYVTRESLKYPPHSPPVDVEQIKTLGFEPQVIAILQLLPYVEGRGSEDNFFHWGGFADHREEHDLARRLCDPLYLSPDEEKGFEEENGPYVRPWELPLCDVGNRGCVVFFNTRNGHITVVSQYGDCDDPAFYGKPKKTPENTSANKNLIESYPSRPAAQFFRDITIRLHTLEWIPFSDNIHEDSSTKEHADLEMLFRNYGWPDNFDADAFDSAAKRYREFRKIEYLRDAPQQRLEPAERTVEHWKKKSQEHSARRVGGVWDNNPNKTPEEVAALEQELKTNQETLDMVEGMLVEVKDQLATRGGPSEMEVVWQEHLESQIKWLQNNIDFCKTKDDEEHNTKRKGWEDDQERLKVNLRNVKSLPRTMKDAIEPGRGTCIGLDWY